MKTEEDPFTDALIDAVARKTLPLAQAAIQLRLLRRNRIDDPDIATQMHELSEAAEVRREELAEMPAPDPTTRIDGLADYEATAAAIDRGAPDDPETANVDENAHGLDDAARHQAYADRLSSVAVARYRSQSVPAAPSRSTHSVGPTRGRTVTTVRVRAPSRRAR